MALVTGKLTFSTSWTQTKTHSGSAPAFNSSSQNGPATTTVSPTISGAACNRVYFVQSTLAAGATVTFDLRSITEPAFGEALTGARIYAMHVKILTTTGQLRPGAANPLVWPFADSSDIISFNSGDSFLFASTTAGTIDATNRNVRIVNTSGGTTLTYTFIVLMGV